MAMATQVPSPRSLRFLTSLGTSRTRAAVDLSARRISLTAFACLYPVLLLCPLFTCPVHGVSMHCTFAVSCSRFTSFPYRVPHFPNPCIPIISLFHSSWVCLTDPCSPCLILGEGRECDKHLLESKVFHVDFVVPVGVSSALLAFKRAPCMP